MERPQTNGHSSENEEPNKNFELSFEYLISKDNLQWITLRTEHATFISVCLQVMIIPKLLEMTIVDLLIRGATILRHPGIIVRILVTRKQFAKFNSLTKVITVIC